MQIFLPGQGSVDITVYRANQAASEYDERCTFERNPDTGQWCVYIAMPIGCDPQKMPVLAFNEVPHPDDVTKRMWESDCVRHGDKIRQEVNRHNEEIKARGEYKLDQTAGNVSEKMEHIIHRAGEAPYHKSFRKLSKKQKN